MTTDTAPDFDLGPLTWVQGEIDQALSRGLDALALFKASPHEITSLKHARSHVHQAAGAIQMVGLDAVTAYTDELERQLSRLEELPPQEAQDACDLIDRACRKLKIFLDELVGGAASGAAEAVSRVRADAAGAWHKSVGADRSFLSGSFALARRKSRR